MRADEMPRIGECPECEALEVPIILTETNQVLCSACGEDIGKPYVAEDPGYDSLWHLHGPERVHSHNHRSTLPWDEYSYHHHQGGDEVSTATRCAGCDLLFLGADRPEFYDREQGA